MASESETTPTVEIPELAAFFESLFSTQRSSSLIVPFFPGLTTATQENNSSPDQEMPPTTGNHQERVIFINPFTQSTVFMEGAQVVSWEPLFSNFGDKGGQPPASKASIEAMPSVEIGESDVNDGGECAICLKEWAIGGLVKEMPCKHRFHGNCIGKWLGINGSCPVCRYKMPVDEEEFGKKRDDEEEGEGERRSIGRQIWVSFSFSGNRSRQDSNQDHVSDSSGSSNDHEMEW